MHTDKLAPVAAAKSTRAYGLDALKLLAMFMVLILHIAGNGGLVASCAEDSAQYHATWLLVTLAYCAVNVFAMVTGYLMVNRKVKYERLFGMWFQVVFYTVLMGILLYIIYPQSVTLKFILQSLFPASFNFYWYFSAYVGLFFFMPYLNKLLQRLSFREATALVITIFVLLSCVSTATYQDPFSVDNGYSVFWLAAMYVLGAYTAQYQPLKRVKSRWFFAGYFVLALLTWGSRPLIKWLSVAILGRELGSGILQSYTSPTVVCMAVLLLLGFSRLSVPAWLGKVLAFASPLSFAVYIIHYHPLFLRAVINGRLVKFADANVLLTVGAMLLFACIVFVGCLLIEAGRSALFKWMRVYRLSRFLGERTDRLIGLDTQTEE